MIKMWSLLKGERILNVCRIGGVVDYWNCVIVKFRKYDKKYK